MANGNSTRWIIGICLTAVLAVSGWAVTATLATRLKAMDSVVIKMDTIDTRGQENRQRIMVLENQFGHISERLNEIKALLKERRK
jgi:hypothetical protein